MGSTDALGSPDRLELGYWLSSEEHPPGRAGRPRGQRGTDRLSHRDDLRPHRTVGSRAGQQRVRVVGARRDRARDDVVARRHRRDRADSPPAPARHRPRGGDRRGDDAGTVLPRARYRRATERARDWVNGGRPAKERRSMLREAIGLIRDLWSGKSVSRRGKHFTVEQAQLFTVPDTPPPIVVAASGNARGQIAGEEADGLVGVAPDSDVVDAFEAAGRNAASRASRRCTSAGRARECEARQTATRWWPNAAIPNALARRARDARTVRGRRRARDRRHGGEARRLRSRRRAPCRRRSTHGGRRVHDDLPPPGRPRPAGVPRVLPRAS